MRIESFGTNYNKMTEAQQYELGSYVNLMEASTMLLVNPIMGLQPKFSEQDYEQLCKISDDADKCYYERHKAMIISMANFLYKIELDDKDMKLLAKSLKKNKEFLISVNMSKKEFKASEIVMVQRALEYRYRKDQENNT